MIEVVTAAAVVLLLGVLADGTAGLLRRLTGRAEGWWSPFRRLAADVRATTGDGDRASVLEAGGAGAAVAGAALAGAMAAGAAGGTLLALYLLLLLVAFGGHLASGTPLTRAGEERGARARRAALAAEPAILLALTGIFARWHTGDLEAIRGAHRVLGLGIQVGPAEAATGVGLAALALLLSAALRLPPAPGDEAGAQGGGALSVTVARWAGAGAGALVAASLILSDGPVAGAGWPVQAGPAVGAAAAAAVVGGLFSEVLGILSARARVVAGGAVLVVAGVATTLVVVA